jgi:Rieske Fe-S protein
MSASAPSKPARPGVPIPSTQPDATGRTPAHPGENRGESLLSRRSFIKNVVRAAVVGALVPGVMSQVLPAVAPDAAGGSGGAPIIRRDKKTNSKIAVTVADLKAQPQNAPFVAEWNFLPAIVYMVRTAALQGSSKKRGYNTAQYALAHPDDDSYAIMVYEGKCKHLGCTVGWNGGFGASKDVESYVGDGINDGRILCPCHQGQYDIHDLALNVPGTPPPYPLNVVRFSIAPSYKDPAGKITGGTNVLMGVEKVVQTSPRAANKDPNKVFALGTMAPTEAAA